MARVTSMWISRSICRPERLALAFRCWHGKLRIRRPRITVGHRLAPEAMPKQAVADSAGVNSERSGRRRSLRKPDHGVKPDRHCSELSGGRKQRSRDSDGGVESFQKVLQRRENGDPGADHVSGGGHAGGFPGKCPVGFEFPPCGHYEFRPSRRPVCAGMRSTTGGNVRLLKSDSKSFSRSSIVLDGALPL